MVGPVPMLTLSGGAIVPPLSFSKGLIDVFAKTIDEIKQDLIDHLASMDKEKMNMMDLNTYAIIVKMVDDMMKPDPSEYLKETIQMMREGCPGVLGGAEVGVVDG